MAYRKEKDLEELYVTISLGYKQVGGIAGGEEYWQYIGKKL